ncbi:Lysophospholipid acyltransferase LPEAT2 [Linum perenne]
MAVAAADDLSSPLLASPPPHITISVDGGDHRSSPGQPISIGTHPYSNGHHSNITTTTNNNPFEFVGIDSFSVPSPSTVDPFRNATPRIDGLYEALKILLLLPIVVLRLILFGLCLAVGYLATKLAIHGWKDKENPMPRWRSRLIYQWIRRKGKPAPREIAPIVVSNHVSYIEPIFYFYEMCPTIVASESHDALPFVGTIIRAMQVIYVNRFSQPSRKNAVNEIKLFDTEMCFQGSEFRERVLAIDFRECCCFPREPLPMEEFSCRFNSVHSSLIMRSNLWSFAIHMCILTNLGKLDLFARNVSSSAFNAGFSRLSHGSSSSGGISP